MNRCALAMRACASRVVFALSVAQYLTLGVTLVAAPPAAQAQVHRNFPPTALRGSIVFGTPPEVQLNGEAARLAPGARIHGPDNMLVMSGTLVGGKADVNYTVENGGLLLEVWILRPEEVAVRPWPSSPAQAAAWHFDPVAQVWSGN